MNINITIWEIIAIHGVHYFADFCFQTHWQASNKSKNNQALLGHVLTYTSCLMPLGAFLLGPFGILWGILNGIIHFGVDYVTSRMSSKRWAKQEWHNFFNVVGADQYIHFVCLFLTFILLK